MILKKVIAAFIGGSLLISTVTVYAGSMEDNKLASFQSKLTDNVHSFATTTKVGITTIIDTMTKEIKELTTKATEEIEEFYDDTNLQLQDTIENYRVKHSSKLEEASNKLKRQLDLNEYSEKELVELESELESDFESILADVLEE